MSGREAIQQRVAGVDRWRRDLQTELSALPETLRQFREAVANLRVIAQRLADTSEAMERLSPVSTSAAAEAARRLEEAFARVQAQAVAARSSFPGADAVSSAVEELGRAVSSMADLNPFFRRPSRPKSSGG